MMPYPVWITCETGACFKNDSLKPHRSEAYKTWAPAPEGPSCLLSGGFGNTPW